MSANENLKLGPTSQCPENFGEGKTSNEKPTNLSWRVPKSPKSCFGGVISQQPANSPAYVCSIFGVGGRRQQSSLRNIMWGTHEIKLWSNKNEHQSEIWNPTNLNPWIQGIWVLTFSRVHHPCCPWRCRKIWPFPHHSPSKTIVWRMCSTTDLGNLLWDSKPWFVWKCLRRILPS